MKPSTFKNQNIIIAKDQPEYLPLPAFVTKEGEVISCWKLSIFEKIRLFFTGCIWLRVLTFNKQLQPQLPQTENPFKNIKLKPEDPS